VSESLLQPTFLLPTFKFWVYLMRSPSGGPESSGADASAQGRGSQWLGDGGFQECSGLELEADVREYLEGGRNDGVIRRVGRVKLQPLVLKRGMFATSPTGRANADLWTWLQGMVEGNLPVVRYDGLVHVFDPTNTAAMATWQFRRGLPSKVAGPSLNGKTGEIAIEELHVLHEGLRLVTP
jgi:phage tail-like protein